MNENSTVPSQKVDRWIMPAEDEPWVYPTEEQFEAMSEEERVAAFDEAFERGVDMRFFLSPIGYAHYEDGRVKRFDTREGLDSPDIWVRGTYEEDDRPRFGSEFYEEMDRLTAELERQREAR